MRPSHGLFAILALLFAPFVFAGQPGRFVDTVLPALGHGPSCWSNIDLMNLGDRPVVAEVEAHKSSGALVALAVGRGMGIRLQPGERMSYRPDFDENTTGAWVKVHEHVPTGFDPVIAVSGKTECVAGNELRSAPRVVAYPTRNPWFTGDIHGGENGEEISLINTSERAAKASLCYSSGTLVSVPDSSRTPELVPLCSIAYDVLIPPFGSREFPVERGGNTHFSLKTHGDSIVLEMLKPLETRLNLYRVDSTIVFGEEALASPNR